MDVIGLGRGDLLHDGIEIEMIQSMAKCRSQGAVTTFIMYLYITSCISLFISL